MDGTLDFNFQQGIMGSASLQMSDSGVSQGMANSQNNSVGPVSGNSTSGVFVSSNATPAAPPSWVH